MAAYSTSGGSAARGKTVSRPAPKPSAKSSAQASDPVAALVRQLISAQTSPLTSAEAARQAQVENQQQQLSNTRQALVQALSAGIHPATAAYDSAIQQTDQLGKNAAALLGAANPTGQDSALLKAIGAPQSQQDQLAAQNQARFGTQGGVLYTQGAAIPGQSLAAGKASTAAYLASLPTVAALQGGQASNALAARSDQSHQQYLAALAHVQAQYPQLYQQLVQAERDYQLKQNALAINQRIAFGNFTGIDPATGQPTLAGKRLSQNAARDKTLKNQGQARLNISKHNATASRQAKTAAAAASSAKSRVGARKTTFYATRTKAFATAQSLYDGPKQQGGSPTPVGAGGGGAATTYKRPTYQKAYAKLWNTYAPALMSAGVNRSAIQQMLRNALVTAGYAGPMVPRTSSTSGVDTPGPHGLP